MSTTTIRGLEGAGYEDDSILVVPREDMPGTRLTIQGTLSLATIVIDNDGVDALIRALAVILHEEAKS